jgi:hypothetical protein
MASQAKRKASELEPMGLRAREFAKFRSPRYEEVSVSTVNDDNAIYPASVNATASGETSIIATAGEDKCIRVKTIMVNNVGAEQRVVSFREGTGGDDKFKNSMPQDGSMWNLNLIGAYWILPPNTALLANLNASGNINIQIGYDIVDAIPTSELTDSMSISESLVTVSA